MKPECVSITIKVENYKEAMKQIEDIRRSAQAAVDILTAMSGLISRGGQCPYCGAKMDESEDNNNE